MLYPSSRSCQTAFCRLFDLNFKVIATAATTNIMHAKKPNVASSASSAMSVAAAVGDGDEATIVATAARVGDPRVSDNLDGFEVMLRGGVRMNGRSGLEPLGLAGRAS